MTDDSVELTLFRYCPNVRRPNEPPVLLVHGGGSTHYAWDLGNGIGLAPWLAGRGHEVWTLDLRGRERTSRARKPWTMGWTLDHLIEFDLPGAIRRIGELTGSDRVQYVGHSMGGMLGYCYLIRFEGQGIGRVATLGSPAFLGHLPVCVGALRKLVEWFMPALPLATLARLAAPLLTWFPRRLVRGAVNLENVDAALVKRYLRHGVASIPAQKVLHLEGGSLRFGPQRRSGTVTSLSVRHLGPPSVARLASAWSNHRGFPGSRVRGWSRGLHAASINRMI